MRPRAKDLKDATGKAQKGFLVVFFESKEIKVLKVESTFSEICVVDVVDVI